MPAFQFQSHWYTCRQLFAHPAPRELQGWLFDKSSLTARLQRRCPGKFRVEVLSQRVEKPRLDELRVLGLSHGASALIRQVRLVCDAQPVVYARSVLPLTTLKGKARTYANLGNRPLGAMLFADRSMRREQVMVTRLNETDALFAQTGEIQGEVWGRRSVFYVSGKPLLVSEYFLPALTRSPMSK